MLMSNSDFIQKIMGKPEKSVELDLCPTSLFLYLSIFISCWLDISWVNYSLQSTNRHKVGFPGETWRASTSLVTFGIWSIFKLNFLSCLERENLKKCPSSTSLLKGIFLSHPSTTGAGSFRNSLRIQRCPGIIYTGFGFTSLNINIKCFRHIRKKCPHSD